MALNDKTISIYCFIDDLLKHSGHQEDCRRKVSDSEIITAAIIAALFFGGNFSKANGYLRGSGMIPQMLDKSRFNRRVIAASVHIYQLFLEVGRYFKDFCCEMQYIIDSFPVKVCDNIRIIRTKILKGKQWRGFHASMRRFFYGVKVQLITTSKGIPVNFYFVPGSEHDSKILESMEYDFNPESTLYGDAAYTNYETEELLKEEEMIQLEVSRKSNSKKLKSYCAEYIITHYRKRIETTISDIKKLFPRTIHAVTKKGFLLKIMLFIFANQLDKIFK